jgi:N-acetylmuramoyl-L-alanine amidase
MLTNESRHAGSAPQKPVLRSVLRQKLRENVIARHSTRGIGRQWAQNPMALFTVSLSAIALLLLALTAQVPAVAQETTSTGKPDTVMVTAGRIAGDAKSTRFYMDLNQNTQFTTFLMADPPRIVIDGPPMVFQFANPDDIEPRGLISYVRYGAISRDRSRIVLSLAEPAEISQTSTMELADEGKFRLLMDITATSQESFEAKITEQHEEIGTSGEVATKGDRVRRQDRPGDRFLVVIDPGHGGIDGGARGVIGTREKDLVLEVSRRVADAIRAAGPFEVKLTRDEDVFMSLRERVSFARRNNADLVISIHADSLRQKWVRGASVYTLSKRASDELAAQLAESENMADIVAGLDNPVEEDAVTDILADLTARETKIFSRSFSATLVNQLSSDINMIKNPQRSASFVVLTAPEVPGVLVELGYLSNEEDEKLMNEAQWQEDLARLLAKSVQAFFQPRL